MLFNTSVVLFQNVVRQCVTLLKAMSGNDDVKVAVVKAGGVELLLKVLSTHNSSPQVLSVYSKHVFADCLTNDYFSSFFPFLGIDGFSSAICLYTI